MRLPRDRREGGRMLSPCCTVLVEVVEVVMRALSCSMMLHVAFVR